ncbi:hypothetical protein CYMTET_29122 [Cymbomonas tetramitiformis]|uniref:Uncharacterized protein n=1 Tax=Cymbomonas tetramitiformis TaxID=36881 RepID=A0AAE0FLP8_9CHLO|nr:hypothetical protein CYMTET_29122 [Cymbomonas tetramitiformis]
MARLADMEKKLATATSNTVPVPVQSSVIQAQQPPSMSGPSQDDVNDMRPRGREVIEKYMSAGTIPAGSTTTQLKPGVLSNILDEMLLRTPNIPRRTASMYVTSRLAYLKNTKNTEGRWKQKFTQTHPQGYFCRYEGPARGFRIFGRPDNLITPAETRAILDFQAADRPKAGPIFDKVKAIDGWTDESIPDDEFNAGDEKKLVVKTEEPAYPTAWTAPGLTYFVTAVSVFPEEEPPEDDGKLHVARFVDMFLSTQKSHAARPVDETDDYEKGKARFCIARGILDVVGEGDTENAPLKGLVVPDGCVEITVHALKEEEDYRDRLLAHHGEGMALLLKHSEKIEFKVAKDDLEHDETSIVPGKEKPTVWIPVKYIRNSSVLQTDANVGFKKRRKASKAEEPKKKQKIEVVTEKEVVVPAATQEDNSESEEDKDYAPKEGDADQDGSEDGADSADEDS